MVRTEHLELEFSSLHLLAVDKPTTSRYTYVDFCAQSPAVTTRLHGKQFDLDGASICMGFHYFVGH